MDEQNNQNTQGTGGGNMPMMIGAIVVVLLIAAGAVYFFVSGDGLSNISNTTENTNVADETVGGEENLAQVDSEMKTFEIDGKNFEFSLEKIEVNQGDTIKIVFTNTEGTHNWQVDEFDAATEIIQTGETAEIVFVADQEGEFEYFCAVGNHRAQGMVGTLIVN